MHFTTHASIKQSNVQYLASFHPIHRTQDRLLAFAVPLLSLRYCDQLGDSLKHYARSLPATAYVVYAIIVGIPYRVSSHFSTL